MRRRIAFLTLTIALMGATGCASSRPDEGGGPEAVHFLSDAFRGAHWGEWTPEFPPDSGSVPRRGR